MMITPIAVQVPMYEIFEGNSCYIYWTAALVITYQMAIGGFGMAIFRVGCIFNLFPSKVEPKDVGRIILVSQLSMLVLLSAINCSGKNFGIVILLE